MGTADDDVDDDVLSQELPADQRTRES